MKCYYKVHVSSLNWLMSQFLSIIMEKVWNIIGGIYIWLTPKLHECEFKFQQACNRSLFYLTAQYLENQIRERDGAAVGTHNVVKNLEMNQVVGVTDLRGRVVRCDTSIARLAADLKTAFDSIRNLGQQQLEQNSRMVESVHALNAHVSLYL